MQQCLPQRPAAWQRAQAAARGGSQSRAPRRSLLPRQRGGALRPTAGLNGDAQDTLVSDGAIKSLSPEARRIFREAQDNIIELNKSRLRALEELKAARQKIAELEEKLEQAVQDASQATAQLQQLGPSGTQQAAAAGAAYAAAAAAAAAGQPQQAMQPEVMYRFNGGFQPPQQQQPPMQPAAVQQMQQPPAAAAAPGVAGPTITVVYETGWGAAYLHHNPDGRGWTSAPGAKMLNGTQEFPDKKVFTVTGNRLEFVINDGGNDWDKPNPFGDGPRNYVIDAPGTYRLKNGRVTKLA